jgi:hypothetical protein
MRRTLIIAAMLLPFPFAAIPVVSVVVAPAPAYEPDFITVDAPADQGQPGEATSYESTEEDVSLTFRSDGYYSGCQATSTSPIEG